MRMLFLLFLSFYNCKQINKHKRQRKQMYQKFSFFSFFFIVLTKWSGKNINGYWLTNNWECPINCFHWIFHLKTFHYLTKSWDSFNIRFLLVVDLRANGETVCSWTKQQIMKGTKERKKKNSPQPNRSSSEQNWTEFALDDCRLLAFVAVSAFFAYTFLLG